MDKKQRAQWAKAYREKHRSRLNQQSADWRRNNPQKKAERDKRYQENHYDRQRMASVKCRAKVRGLEFDLTIEDFVVPELCPVLGVPLIRNREGYASDHSASLDRIDNSKGYVKGNVVWVSRKANTMKNNATLDELKKVVAFYEVFNIPI
jgi:hypothetical protein